MAKYKVGDKVWIVNKYVHGSSAWNLDGEMDHWLGAAMTVREVSGTNYYMEEDRDENEGFGWVWRESMISGLADLPDKTPEFYININFYGNETRAICLPFRGKSLPNEAQGKAGVAHRSPVDEYKWKTGARIAFERLLDSLPDSDPTESQKQNHYPVIAVDTHCEGCYVAQQGCGQNTSMPIGEVHMTDEKGHGKYPPRRFEEIEDCNKWQKVEGIVHAPERPYSGKVVCTKQEPCGWPRPYQIAVVGDVLTIVNGYVIGKYADAYNLVGKSPFRSFDHFKKNGGCYKEEWIELHEDADKTLPSGRFFCLSTVSPLCTAGMVYEAVEGDFYNGEKWITPGGQLWKKFIKIIDPNNIIDKAFSLRSE